MPSALDPNCTLIKPKLVQIIWTLPNGAIGTIADYPEYADRNIAAEGTFGAGGAYQIEGSNDGVNWHILTDMQGNLLSGLLVSGVHMIQENTLYVRPHVTNGDGTTVIVFTLIGRRL